MKKLNVQSFLILGVLFVGNFAQATYLTNCKVGKILAERDKPGSMSEYVNYELNCPAWGGPFRISNESSMATKLLLMAKQKDGIVNVDFDSNPQKADDHAAFPAKKVELQ